MLLLFCLVILSEIWFQTIYFTFFLCNFDFWFITFLLFWMLKINMKLHFSVYLVTELRIWLHFSHQLTNRWLDTKHTFSIRESLVSSYCFVFPILSFIIFVAIKYTSEPSIKKLCLKSNVLSKAYLKRWHSVLFDDSVKILSALEIISIFTWISIFEWMMYFFISES